jgi:prevent-host-death family protein
MRTITALEVRAKFGQVIDEAAAGERFIVERAGVPVAAIVPLEDLDAVNPEKILARRLEAIDSLARKGRRFRERYGPTDVVALIKEGHEERDRRIMR